MKIQVDIERLVLDGLDLPAGQRPVLQASVEAELARLLTTGGLHPVLLSGGFTPSLRVNGMQWSGDSNPAGLGRQIARSVYGGIGRVEEKPR